MAVSTWAWVDAIIFSLLLMLLAAQTSWADQTAAFDKIWAEASAQIYPKEKDLLFSAQTREQLRGQSAAAANSEALAAILNPFLLSLKISHTYLYDSQNPDFYMLKSLFSTRDIKLPKIYHAGMQLQRAGTQFVVRNVMDGYPAAKAGLRRGDILRELGGKEFHPFGSFNPPVKNPKLVFLRGGKEMSAEIQPVLESPHYSFWQATRNSVKIIARGSKKIGYIHLWSGTDDHFLETLKSAVLVQFKNTDALVLDLRDGFGGAWWDYLDPFFADSKSYFKPMVINREGRGKELAATLKRNSKFYAKPMAVLINEGVRSGKEAVAYQFKKTKRAQLVGTATAGAFAMGKGLFADEKDYLLYLSVGEIYLDGNPVEGHPIRPDIEVPFPLENSPTGDPQLEEALKILSEPKAS